ncbi:MAG: homing endonuclease associated repeat-containing protein [Maioricimonas sp. JB049]
MPPIEQVSRQWVLRLARELAAEYGESLTLTAFRRETGLSQHAIFDLFGSWKKLRLAVGLSPEAPRARNRVTNDLILERMRELAAEHGERLTERAFVQATGYSARLIRDRFGSWSDLRLAVGLSPRAKVQQHYTTEELLEDLYRVYSRTRSRPLYHKHRVRGGRISPTTIQQRFGSWTNACDALKGYLRARGVYNDWMPLPRDICEN